MITREFRLYPFPDTAPRFPLEITGTIARRDRTLAHCAMNSGETWGPCCCPGRPATPARLDGLWRETCLEFFLPPQDSPRYWGIQPVARRPLECAPLPGLSPGDDRGNGLCRPALLGPARAGPLAINHAIDLAGIIPTYQALDAAASAVITDRHLETTYWALTHPGPQPDFHRRDAFLIDL